MKNKKRLCFIEEDDEEEAGIGKGYFDRQEEEDQQQESLGIMENLLEKEDIYEYDSIYTQIKTQKVKNNQRKV